MTDFRETKIKILSEEHSRAFQEVVIAAGGGWWDGREVRNLHAKFLYVDDDLILTYGGSLGHFEEHDYKEIQFPLPVSTKNVWSGEDVPPVGTVCEYRLNNGKWFKCKIMYVLSGADDGFVAWCDQLGIEQFLTFSSNRYKLQLRKIKTPEQIAAEERSVAIQEMMGVASGFGRFLDILESLYDAGYRKTEVKK